MCDPEPVPTVVVLVEREVFGYRPGRILRLERTPEVVAAIAAGKLDELSETP